MVETVTKKPTMKELMNLPKYCYYCRKKTGTEEWDCTICGLSKTNPTKDEYEEIDGKV